MNVWNLFDRLLLAGAYGTGLAVGYDIMSSWQAVILNTLVFALVGVGFWIWEETRS